MPNPQDKTQEKPRMNKLFSLSLIVTSFLMVSTASAEELSRSDQYGCQAYLCFAGGMGYAECQSTISKVKRDLLRGRSFPSCSMLANPDGSIGGNGSPRIWTEKTRKRIYIKMQDPTGEIKQLSSFKR